MTSESATTCSGCGKTRPDKQVGSHHIDGYESIVYKEFGSTASDDNPEYTFVGWLCADCSSHPDRLAAFKASMKTLHPRSGLFRSTYMQGEDGAWRWVRGTVL